MGPKEQVDLVALYLEVVHGDTKHDFVMIAHQNILLNFKQFAAYEDGLSWTIA